MDWLSSPTFVTVLVGATLLGVVGGVIGCFALLRRQSLLGDALAHAALPGVCLAFLISGGKHPLALAAGAIVAGIVGALFIMLVVRGSRVKEDSALGIVLSVFFGVGIVLLTFIQKLPSGNQAGLDHFLFGQAATLMQRDVLTFGAVGAIVLVVVLAFYKEFKLLCFDRAFGAILGFPMRGLEIALTCLLVVVVVVGLQTVGVVLMIAALVTPAAAARQWTDRLGRMLVLSAAIGGASSAAGVVASAAIERLPTGPMIVICSSAVLLASVLLAPNRGLVFRALRARRTAQRIRRENLLKDIYRWGERQGDHAAFLSMPLMMGMRGQAGSQIRSTLRSLLVDGLVESTAAGGVRLSSAGRHEARRIVRRHRIWELYLVRRLDLPADHVHRDAEAMEHVLSDEMIAEFERLLGDPKVDPHGRPIPGATEVQGS